MLNEWQKILIGIAVLAALLFAAYSYGRNTATDDYRGTAEQLRSELRAAAEVIEASKLTTTDSARLIVNLQERLAKADALQVQSAIIIEKMKTDLLRQETSLQTANALQAKYEKETKAKINSLRRDRTLWEIVAVVAAGVAIFK